MDWEEGPGINWDSHMQDDLFHILGLDMPEATKELMV